MLQISGYQFAGAPLTIETYIAPIADRQMNVGGAAANGSTAAPSATDTKNAMTGVLNKRFFQEAKILDLSRLSEDPDLQAMGIFNSTSTESKFFPALMRVWDMNFESASKRIESVESVSLASNGLTSISAVTSLAQTLPEVKNLDMSNNDLKDAQSLAGWRWKFRNLEFLDLSGNPFSADPTFKDTMLKWYPKLRILNNTEVRTAEEVAESMRTPIPVQKPYFQDEAQIAENFVSAFFARYDTDRNGLLDAVYDAKSTYSLNVNGWAPRDVRTETASWDSYMKKSRNLLKLTHLPARMSRLHVGTENIRELWNSLPQTKHTDMLAHPEEWLIECHPMPGLPDMTGQSPTGVGGLLIMVHGSFEETGQSGNVDRRSFDRTFVLGPGGGAGGLRVINDALTLRSYGGHEAWNIDANMPVQQPSPLDGSGLAAPGKSELQVQQEQLIMQMSNKTNMTLPFSEMALSGNGWNMEAALKNFEDLKVWREMRTLQMIVN